MRNLILIVFAMISSLSTFANTINYDLKNDSLANQEIISNLTKQIEKFDQQDDRIEIKNIKIDVISLTNTECTMSVKVKAKVTLFGTGFEVEFGASVTAPTCAEASRLAWQGVKDAANGLKNAFNYLEKVVDNVF